MHKLAKGLHGHKHNLCFVVDCLASTYTQSSERVARAQTQLVKLPRLFDTPSLQVTFEIAETLVVIEGVGFYMISHDIPCYSKAFLRLLWEPRELIFIWYATIFHAIPRHSWDPCGNGDNYCLHDIPRYSMLFQILETLVGTRGVDLYMVIHDIPNYSKAFLSPLWVPKEFIFYMIFHDSPCYSNAFLSPLWEPRELILIFHYIPRHSWDPCGYGGCRFPYDIPCYSKAFLRPLWVPRESNFILYSTIGQAIPRHSWVPCEYRGSRFFYDIPRYPMLFQGMPWTLQGTDSVEFSSIFHDIPWYSKACHVQGTYSIFCWYSKIFHAIPRHGLLCSKWYC